MAEMLDDLAGSADVVIIDTPPLLPVTDAAVLAAKADGVVLVTAINETRRGALERAREILESTSARLLGTVVNKMPATGGYYYHYYASYYGETQDTGRKNWLRRLGKRAAAPPVDEGASSGVGDDHASDL
jgi:Mrp family chromosome partitioning ATPase